jgi:hypothetical protein
MDCRTRKQINAENARKDAERAAVRKEILTYIFDNTLPQAVNIAVDTFRFHALYRNRENYILHKWFDGHRLHYSVFMVEMFNEYLDAEQEIRCDWILCRMKELKRRIKWAKRDRQDCSAEVMEHNTLSDEYNNLMKGINAFVKAYNSHRRKVDKK